MPESGQPTVRSESSGSDGARPVLRVVAGGAGAWPAVTVWAAVVVLSGLAFLEGWAVLPFAAGCSLGALILVELVTATWRAGRC